MKIAFVAAYPPSRIGLNEYARHLVEEMAHDSSLEILVVADEIEAVDGVYPPEIPLPPNVRVVRCWRYNDWRSLFYILREVLRFNPDFANLQMLFTTFGDKKVPAAAGLLVGPLLRLLGFPVVVTLHHLIEFIDLKSTVLGRSRISRMALELATTLLVHFTTVVVLQKRYADTLVKKYRGRTVRLIRHGYYTFEGKPRSYLAGHRVLVFGKFGTYKRLEFPIDVCKRVYESFPNVSLTICGMSHPSTPNYLEEVKNRHADLPFLRFTGYVPEELLADEFAKCDLMLLSYQSCTGVASAELHACRFGLPIISPILEELSALHEEEGIQANSFTPGDVQGAAQQIIDLFADRDRMQFQADSNFALAMRTPMRDVAESYVALANELVKGRPE